MYKCPKCGMEFDKPGKCTMCHVPLVEGKAKGGIQDHSAHHEMMLEDFKKRFIVSLIVTIPVLVLSPLIQSLLNFSLDFAGREWVLFALSSVVYFYGGLPFLKGLIEETRAKNFGMMTLIALAISVAYIYSAAVVFGLEGEVFFWELVTLIDVMLLGHWIEMKSVLGASAALKKLAQLLPKTAHKVAKGETADVPIEELKKGDTVLVKPGEKIPIDGNVIEGKSYVDESLLTGESKPVGKSKGAKVIAGAINGDGSLTVAVTGTGEESYLSQVINLVSQAQQEKSKTQRLADRAAFWLTLIAIVVGFATFAAWMLLTGDAPTAVARLATVMVITCPHALGVAIPLVVSVSTAQSARKGLLIRNRTAFENARKISTVVFDKTGTLTEGTFGVTDVKGDVLQLAAAVEQHSEHPIGKSIVSEAKKRGKIANATSFKASKGEGVMAKVEGKTIAIVSPGYLKRNNIAFEPGDKASTTVYILADNKLKGSISLSDVVREESKQAVTQLKRSGIKCWMITGDNEEVAQAVAEQLELDGYYAQVLPHQKQEKIKELQQKGEFVAMVGDGINDAPALAQADVGIAIGSGTDVAIETADIILTSNNPRDVATIITFGRKTYSKMVQNLFWATGYNVVAIPLAAGVLAPIGFVISPAVGAALMSASTVIVAINARLLKL